MKRFFVAIFDYLSSHKVMAMVAMSLLILIEVLLGLRLGFKENITDFLPQDEENRRYMSVYENMTDQNCITVLFRPYKENADEGHYAVLDAVQRFESLCDSFASVSGEEIELRCYVDESVALEAMDYLRNNIALFLSDDDYHRIDSLLAIPGYVDSCLSNVSNLLAFPMGAVAEQAVLSDPLSLFTPVYRRLENMSPSERFDVDEGVLFDDSGVAFAFVYSPYESNNTNGNSRIAKILNDATSTVTLEGDSVAVSAVGAPLIAVGNASQIKHDSLFAMLLSVTLIVLILVFALRSLRNIALLALSVLAGWLFALAAVSIFSPSISIIVIGIGSVLVGIAVNYPLHFLEHIQSHPDRRETLKEMVEPLVTGNITTVSAFACLVFINSSAMRDLGLFGATMLVGTILFVMVFLPLMAGKCKSKKKTKVENEDVDENRCDWFKRMCGLKVIKVSSFVVVVILTVWFAIRSTNPSFDDNLHNINYISSLQAADLDYLNSSIADTDMQVEYVVSTAATLDDALKKQEQMGASARRRCLQLQEQMSGCICEMQMPTIILPSKSFQDSSLTKWVSFRKRYGNLAVQLNNKSLKYGFAPSAFQPFMDAVSRDYDVVDPADMTPLRILSAAYISGFETNADSGMVVSMIPVPVGCADSCKAMIRDCGSVFVFDVNDVGNNLVSSLNFDFNYILFVCGFVVFFFLWISFGRIELALLSFLPLAVAWFWILGIMDLASVKFNIVNIILATFIFGQGDDYTIFITEGMLYENAYGRHRLKSYRRSVIISALLMFVGIGSLVFAKHPAMQSLAEVAIIGMIVVVVMACYLPPLIFRWITQRKGMPRRVPITLGRLFKTFFILLVFFLAAFVLVTPYTFIYRLIGRDSEAKRLRFHRMIQWFTGKAVRMLPGVDFKVENLSNEDFSKPAVIIANHQSHLDLLCMLQLSPKLVILTADWVWRNPIYGAIIRYAEFYPVHDGFENLAPKLKSLVDRGYSVVVFPEGTRSVTGEVGRFHKGAFELAQQLDIDILPVFLHGGCHVMPKDDILLRKGQLTVEIDRRINFNFNQNDNALNSYIRRQTSDMHRYYVTHFAELRRRIEDENYWLPFVRYQYLYKGRDVARRCRQNIDAYLKDGVINVGQGEIPLLKVLANPDCCDTYTFTDEDDYLIAKRVFSNLNLDVNLNVDLNYDKE